MRSRELKINSTEVGIGEELSERGERMAASQEPMLPKGVLFGRAHQFCSKRILNTMYCFRYKLISNKLFSSKYLCFVRSVNSNVSSGPKKPKTKQV